MTYRIGGQCRETFVQPFLWSLLTKMLCFHMKLLLQIIFVHQFFIQPSTGCETCVVNWLCDLFLKELYLTYQTGHLTSFFFHDHFFLKRRRLKRK